MFERDGRVWRWKCVLHVDIKFTKVVSIIGCEIERLSVAVRNYKGNRLAGLLHAAGTGVSALVDNQRRFNSSAEISLTESDACLVPCGGQNEGDWIRGAEVECLVGELSVGAEHDFLGIETAHVDDIEPHELLRDSQIWVTTERVFHLNVIALRIVHIVCHHRECGEVVCQGDETEVGGHVSLRISGWVNRVECVTVLCSSAHFVVTILECSKVGNSGRVNDKLRRVVDNTLLVNGEEQRANHKLIVINAWIDDSELCVVEPC